MTSPAGHDYVSAAKELNLSAWWLKKHIADLPHLKYGHLVRFTDDHLAEIRAMHEQRPESRTEPTRELRPSTTRRRKSA
jgi:hypothetical protein